MLLTNNTGAKVESYAYDVWGKVSAKDASGQAVAIPQSRFLYTAREFDTETGLYHYRTRAYSPTLGRFLQTDSIDFDGGDVNLFRYVANAPLNYNDPLGLCPDDGLWLLGISLPNTFLNLLRLAKLISGITTIGGSPGTINKQPPTPQRPPPAISAPASGGGLPPGGGTSGGSGGGKGVGPGPGYGAGGGGAAGATPTCFIKGTLVLTPNGLVPIENLKVGDMVIAFNQESNNQEPKKVTRLIRGEDEIFYAIKVKSSIVYCTARHSFYVDGHMQTAESLKGKASLFAILNKKAGNIELMYGIVRAAQEVKRQEVFNISVEKCHNYFVGNDRILCSNQNKSPD